MSEPGYKVPPARGIMPSGHYPVWRCLSWDTADGEETGEIEVCGICVPKHSSFPGREAVPEWPLHRDGEAP